MLRETISQTRQGCLSFQVIYLRLQQILPAPPRGRAQGASGILRAKTVDEVENIFTENINRVQKLLFRVQNILIFALLYFFAQIVSAPIYQGAPPLGPCQGALPLGNPA